MRRLVIIVTGFILFATAFAAGAQVPIPVDVFAFYDQDLQQVTLYFSNPVSGLSTPVTLPGFRRSQLIMYEMTVTQAGVIYKDPNTNQPMLASPDGRVAPHPFIPQQTSNLVAVDWVVSQDGNSIAWVEVFPSETRWIANLYVSDVFGANLMAVAPPPESSYEPFRRAYPVAVSNNRQRIFYDAAYPLESWAYPEYYQSYIDLHVYIAERQVHQQLPEEPRCICGAGLDSRGQILLRLEEQPLGYDLRIWDLNNNGNQAVTNPGDPFALAGDFYISPTNAYYSQSRNLADNRISAQFSLMQVDLTNNTQQILIPPSAQRFRVMAENAQGIIMVDVFGGGTYKLDFGSQTPELVSEQTWLGTINLP